MSFRSLTLLTALLMLISLSGCGTDTKTANDLDGNGFTANHFDSNATPNIIEGYVIRKDPSGNLLCGDCHKIDQAEVTINRQWADSAHAGHILSNGVVKDGDKLSPWAHYNWDDSTGTTADRKACQQCHTATGNSNFMKAQVAGTLYDPTSNDFSHLEGWAINKTSGQNELLYCWGCHLEVETGALLAPNDKGITTTNWTDGSYLANGTAAKLPINVTLSNLGNSNVCMGCHSGRGNIETLMGQGFTATPTSALFITDATTFTTPKPTATATATHYMNAGATIFNEITKVGYEFLPATEYTNPAFRHNSTNCVACHMKSASSHSFNVVSKDATTGEMTTIKTQTTCDGCHSVPVMNTTLLQHAADGYEEALAVFNAALATKGYIWTPNHPYFMFDFNGDQVLDDSDKRYTFTHPTTKVVSYHVVVPVDATEVGGWKDVVNDDIIDSNDSVLVSPLWPVQGDLGAAHNYNYLHHEAGAYAHNSKYAKRLIFDSIDWLDGDVNVDGNNMDGQITIDAANPAARLWLDADVTSGIAIRP
jgi:hypothetical protein